MEKKSSPGTRQTDGKNLVWFGEIERKFAKLSMATFTYPSSSLLFYAFITLYGRQLFALIFNSQKNVLLSDMKRSWPGFLCSSCMSAVIYLSLTL
jgi:hypothetical protein